MSIEIFVYAGDGNVDTTDIVEVGKNYGKPGTDGANPRADINKDGKVDTADLIAIASAVNYANALKDPKHSTSLPVTEEYISE